MSVQDDLARKKIFAAIDALKKQWSDEAMRQPLTEEGNAARHRLVVQFQVATTVGQQIATEAMKG